MAFLRHPTPTSRRLYLYSPCFPRQRTSGGLRLRISKPGIMFRAAEASTRNPLRRPIPASLCSFQNQKSTFTHSSWGPCFRGRARIWAAGPFPAHAPVTWPGTAAAYPWKLSRRRLHLFELLIVDIIRRLPRCARAGHCKRIATTALSFCPARSCWLVRARYRMLACLKRPPTWRT